MGETSLMLPEAVRTVPYSSLEAARLVRNVPGVPGLQPKYLRHRSESSLIRDHRPSTQHAFWLYELQTVFTASTTPLQRLPTGPTGQLKKVEGKLKSVGRGYLNFCNSLKKRYTSDKAWSSVMAPPRTVRYRRPPTLGLKN